MKQYYECHITLQENPSNFNELEIFIKSQKWKFSCIDGDPILGSGLKCYATKHFNANKEIEFVLNELFEMADKLSLKSTVLRRKVEMVIFDDRIKKQCSGGCAECHLDDLTNNNFVKTQENT